MQFLMTIGLALAWWVIFLGGWLGWQLLRQNGRMLLRLDELEQRLNELEFGENKESQGLEPAGEGTAFEQPDKKESNGDNREGRFGNRSLARSKIKRDGLKPGTQAPEFRLPRLDGHGELSLQDFRGRRLLLVFSSPHCGPCNTLAPELEKFHREHRDVEVVMISKGEPKENRAKVKEYWLTFPIVLQQQWEISRRYAMFATPIAYFIDEQGIIAQDAAVGLEPILALLENIKERCAEPAEVVVNGQFTVMNPISARSSSSG
jgi:peroxiredoxin